MGGTAYRGLRVWGGSAWLCGEPFIGGAPVNTEDAFVPWCQEGAEDGRTGASVPPDPDAFVSGLISYQIFWKLRYRTE